MLESGISPPPALGAVPLPMSGISPLPTGATALRPAASISPLPTAGMAPLPTAGICPLPTEGAAPLPTPGGTTPLPMPVSEGPFPSCCDVPLPRGGAESAVVEPSAQPACEGAPPLTGRPLPMPATSGWDPLPSPRPATVRKEQRHACVTGSSLALNTPVPCYHEILCTSYQDHVTKEEVCPEIQQVSGPHKDLLTIVKRRKTEVVWTCLPFTRSG